VGCTAAVVAAACIATARPAAAQATDSLSVAIAIERALATHPSPQSARATLDAAAASGGEARAAWWPTLRLQASATQYEEPSLVVPLHGFTPGALPVFDETVFYGSLAAGWTVFDGGARGARIHRADALEASAAAGFDATAQSLVARTLAAYLEVRTQREILEAQDQRLSALAAELDRVRRRLAAGSAARVELLRVEAAVARAEAERVQSQQAAHVAAAELARLVGVAALPPLRAVTLADTTMPDRDGAMQRALARSPAHTRAGAQERAAVAAASLARAARWPELRAQGTYQGWSDDDGHDALEWNLGLQLAYPLFTGGATRRAIERAEAERRGARATLDDAALDIAQNVDRALARLAESRARVRSFAVAADRSAEVARIETLALDAGSGTQTDWLTAQADLLEARAALVEARHGEIAARAELARHIGDLDSAWIARTLETRP